MLNVESVGRTFKPLWKSIGELKIRDVGDNILLFEFEDILDLERVLEFKPWMFDKSLVAFQRATLVEEVPLLDFSKSFFWVQLHNVLENRMNQATSESIGGIIGTVIQVADPKDDGARGEFLRVRISIDISKPLPRCHKLWANGKQVGLVGIKYERLPNFCYCCGRVNHGERECEVWLRGKGHLKHEE